MNIYIYANFEFIKIYYMQKDTKIENTVHNVILLLHLKNIVKTNIYLNFIFFMCIKILCIKIL